MNFRKNIKLGVALSFFLSSVSVHADTTRLKQSGDWSLWESNDGQQSTCFIEATAEESDQFDGAPTTTTRFRISKSKNSPGNPAEMMIRLEKNDKGTSSLVGEVKGGSRIAFGAMDNSKRTFWGVPKSIAAVFQQFSNNKHMTVSGALNRAADVWAVAGYGEILAEMQNQCNGGASIFSPTFEQEFLAQVPDSINPGILSIAKVTDLRSTYYTAYKAYADISETKAQLAQLLAKYQSLIDELKTNRDSANLILNSQLPQVQSDLTTAQNQQVEARAELARIESIIPGLSAKIARSQKILDTAKAIIAPLQPEHDRLAQNLSSAQTILSDSQNRLSYIEGRLRDGAQQLVSLRSEADSLERYLPQKRSDLDRALFVYRDIQNRRSQYNMNWERDRLLRNNFDYTRSINDRNQMQNNLNQAANDTQRLRVERDRVENELRQCRMGMVAEALVPGRPPGGGGDNSGGGQQRPPPYVPPGNGGGGGGGNHGPGNGGPGQGPGDGGGHHGPGNGGPGQGPGDGGGHVNPPPPPVRDCSRLESALNIANSQVANSEANQQNISNRLNEINSRISQIERQVDYQVRQEYDRLVSSEDQARREYERMSSDVSNDESRIAQIRNSDIPRLENEQSSLSTERPSVIARISDAQANVNRYTQELATFNSANDWDRKVAAVDSATTQLQNDQSNLDSVLAQKQQQQQKLDLNILLAQQAQDKINSLNAQLNELNRRATELNAGLQNLPAERAPLDNKIASFQSNVAALKAKFLDLLK